MRKSRNTVAYVKCLASKPPSLHTLRKAGGKENIRVYAQGCKSYLHLGFGKSQLFSMTSFLFTIKIPL